jgi:hypothetical protein
MEVAWVPQVDEIQRRWDPRVFRVLSFGHLPATVDWLWIQTLADSSLTRYSAGVHPKLYYNLDLLTDLDPVFFAAYAAGANLLAVIRDDGIGSRDLVLKGIRFSQSGLLEYSKQFRDRYWSHTWQLHVLLAYIDLFELNDLPGASVAFREAAQYPGVPDYVRSLAKRFEIRGEEYSIGLNLLRFMIEQSKDEAVKTRLAEQAKSLEVARFLFQVNEEFSRYRASLKNAATGSAAAWERFVRQRTGQAGGGIKDPWGGVLRVDSFSDRVISTTLHDKVMGLE